MKNTPSRPDLRSQRLRHVSSHRHLKNLALGLALAGLSTAGLYAADFTGDSGVDLNFSNPDNWVGNTLPTQSENIFVDNTAANLGRAVPGNPAVVGPGWTALFSPTASNNYNINAGNVAAVEVQNGGELYTGNVTVGGNNATFELSGSLRIKNGGLLRAQFGNSNIITVGRERGEGILTIEDGATVEFGKLLVEARGTHPTETFEDIGGIVEFVFGQASNSTFTNIQAVGPDTYTIDGLVRVDLSAFNGTPGDYLLFDGQTTSGGLNPITGDLADALDNNGGTIAGSGTGTFANGHFEITGNAVDWELSLTDNGQDLQFTVVPEPGFAALAFGVPALLLAIFLRRHSHAVKA